MNKLVLSMIGASAICAVSAGIAGPIADAKKCLSQAADVAKENVVSVGQILADAVSVSALKSGQLKLNGWDGSSSDAKGIYHTSHGWHTSRGAVTYYDLVYMGRGCGILSKSRLACKLQIKGHDLYKNTNLDHELKQSIGLECTVCRGVEYTSDGDIFGVPKAMRASALKSDLGIAKNFSTGVVKITTFEDESEGNCGSSRGVSGPMLTNL